MKKREKKPPKGTPANLAELLKGNQQGYEIRTGYSLQLKHGLMGYFPAIYKQTEGRADIVVTFDRELMQEVWKTMSPRRSQLDESQFFVNQQTGVCYPMLGNTKYEQEHSEPIVFLTREEFVQLMAADPHPFEWAPGLIGNDMSLAEFRQTLEAAAREYGVSLPQ
ncbi:MAG: hypothetical protein KGJ93_01495 [Patescibacteria group bacterium]|nr:hypothetical protein [Patescibacteria group bacterium]